MEPNNDRFVDIFNAEEALNNNKIYAFMLFVDKIFIGKLDKENNKRDIQIKWNFEWEFDYSYSLLITYINSKYK